MPTGAWPLLVACALAIGAGLACSKPEAPAAPDVVAEVAPEPPPIPPHPTTEDGVLQAFTQATEQRDFAALKRVLAPELGLLHDRNPEEFWARGGEWVKNAQTGLSIAARADDADTAKRWRALVRFGNGLEETVEFMRIDGLLVLADL